MNDQILAQPDLPAHLRAFVAVVRREWMIFRRYPSWIISLIVWPLIFPMGYLLTARALSGQDGSGLAQFKAATGISDYIGYIAVGTMIWMWQNVVLWNVGYVLRNEQMRGTLESNWLTPAWRFSFLLGSSVPQLFSMLMMMAVSVVEYALFFGVRFDGSLWLSLLVILVSIPSIYGLGFAFASVVITAREANAFVFLVRGVVMIFCGITFPASMLPAWMQSVAQWLPQTYIIHAVRSAALSTNGLSAVVPDLQALLLFGLFWLAAGYYLFNWMERRARQTGAIGQYQEVFLMQKDFSLSRPGLLSHVRAAFAIALKDWKQYWRYPLNAVSTIFQPLIWLTPVYFMGRAFSVNGQAQGFAQYSGTPDFMSFILIGTVLTNFINAIFWGMGFSMKEDMDSGVMESNWLTPIPRLLILVGHSLTNLTVTAATSIVMLAVAALVFGFRVDGEVLNAFIPIIPMLLGLYGFGFAFAALVLIMREANTMVDISSFLVQIFSGTNFPVNALPGWLLPVALALPLTYGLDAVRGYLLKIPTILPLRAELVLLVVFMAAMLWLGSWAFGSLERRVRKWGTLGQH